MMASSQSREFVIPRGYVKQELSDVTTKYIKGEVLQQWLDKRKHIFGSRCAFITDRSSDQHVLAVKRKLTDDELDELEELSYPKDKKKVFI